AQGLSEEISMTSSHTTFFNLLPEVEQASSLLAAHPEFMSSLEDVGRVLQRARLRDTVCLKLLHRHTTLQDGQCLVRGEASTALEVYVTEVISTGSKDLLTLSPLTWAIRETDASSPDLIPIEFSVEKDIAARHRLLLEEPEIVFSIVEIL